MTERRPSPDRERERRFLALVHEHEGRLQRICRIYERDPEARQDLHQEILVQLWRALPSFAGESLPGTWLYRVALNTALGHRRREARRREVPMEDLAPGGVEELHADGDPLPVESLVERERRELLHEAIERLDDTGKALVSMYLDECSYREMAEVLGISEGNVGVKLNRIRKALAARLEGVR